MSNGYKIENGYITVCGKKFKIVFQSKSVKEVNDYCNDHDDCGVLEDTDKMIYVCEFNETVGE